MARTIQRKRAPIDDVLADLARHPGWEVLRERANAEQEKQASSLRDFLLLNPAALDPLKLERARGFWAGQRWLLRQASNELSAYMHVAEEEEDPTT